jgi:hypothetical protein
MAIATTTKRAKPAHIHQVPIVSMYRFFELECLAEGAGKGSP